MFDTSVAAGNISLITLKAYETTPASGTCIYSPTISVLDTTVSQYVNPYFGADYSTGVITV